MSLSDVKDLSINGKAVTELRLDGVKVWPALPEGYTELEYIESTAAQYLDTGVYVNPNYTVEVTFVMTQRKSTWDTLFGTRSAGTSRFTARWANSATGNLGVHRSVKKGASYQNFNDTKAKKTAVVDGYHTIRLAKNVYSFDGEVRNTYTASTDLASFPYKLFLFALCNAGSPADHGYFRIKDARIWNSDGELIRHYVPCKNPDGVAGMHDYVNRTFTKSGSSTAFVAGPAV